MLKKIALKRKGFTLIEVLIFVTIISLFFVTAVTVTTVSIKNMRVNHHKILAKYYNQELINWLYGQKEEDWNNFISHSGSSYCFNTAPISVWPSTSGLCSNFDGLDPAIYKRELTLTNVDCGGGSVCKANIEIITRWQDLGRTNKILMKTVFSVWE